MIGKYFLDTNFLVYCFSGDEPLKQQKCLRLLEEAEGKTRFVLSTQVLNEFAAVMLGKFKQDPMDVKSILSDLALFEVVGIDVNLIRDAVDIHTLYKISFWDSLIVSGAKHAHCQIIFTEDLQHNAIIAGVRIRNPFLD